MILFYREVDLVSSIFNIEELEANKTMVEKRKRGCKRI